MPRVPATVEAAVYFVVTVTEDGHGGADDEHGTDLLGTQRRVAAFDGTTKIVSPSGGAGPP